MQAMTLARADSLANLRRILLYGLIPVLLFSGLIWLVLAVPGVRRGVLQSFFEIDDPSTIEFIRETLPYTLILPLVMALRASGRGLLMRGGRTSFVTLASLAGLAVLLTAKFAAPVADVENGAVTGYVAWILALSIETALLAWGTLKVGLTHCVAEGGRSSALPEGPIESGSSPRGVGVDLTARR
jgi:hypothetical protein